MQLARSALAGPVLFALAALASAQATAPTDDLAARLETIRAKAKLPALGAALVTVDGLQGAWVAGTRRADGQERVEADDIWHLGSCTKSMTATLIALLVTRGDLSWDTVLPELLPAAAEEMDDAYRDLTLVELLCHRAGLPTEPNWGLFANMRTSTAPLVEQRANVANVVLSTPPHHPPREVFLYANDGFLIAGHIAEVATGKPWETLMRELLFGPLGMTSAGFGAPGTKDPSGSNAADQPRGHTAKGDPLEPSPFADNPPAVGPAGTVHASLADWAKYVQLHLRGAREDVKVGEITLTRDTFAILHAPYDGPGQKYGFGWVFETRAWAGGDGTAFWHNGSNTMWYCVSWLGPGNGVAALVTTNQGSPGAQGATDQAAALVLEEFERRAASPATR